MITKQMYQTALDVQGACNLSGVVHAFSRIMIDLHDHSFANKLGTEWISKHPISVLFASKIASLTGCESGMNFSEAYDKVLKELSK